MNNNIFNGQQIQNAGFYPYNYHAAIASQIRPEASTFMMAPGASSAIIKGRPVSSLEEARVAQIDLDGSVFFFPDLGNKKIYTKRINADGTASLNCYSLDTVPVEEESQYVTRGELNELKVTLEDIIEKLKAASGNTATKAKINF